MILSPVLKIESLSLQHLGPQFIVQVSSVGSTHLFSTFFLQLAEHIFTHIFLNFEEETNYFINFIQTFLLFTFQTSAQIFLFLIFSSNFGFNVFQSGRSYFCSFQKTRDVMWLFHPSWQCLLVKYTIL